MNEFSIVIFFIGLLLFIIGLICLLVSFFVNDSKKVATLGLKILLVGTLLTIGGFTLCTATLDLKIH